MKAESYAFSGLLAASKIGFEGVVLAFLFIFQLEGYFCCHKVMV